MGRPSRFSPEVRERAVRMVEEHQRQAHASEWARVAVGGAEAWLHGRDATEVGTARHSVTPAHRPGPDDERARAPQGTGARGSRAEAGERDPAEGVRVFCPGGARPPREVATMVQLHSTTIGIVYGVEPICTVLPIAPSTYHRHRAAAGHIRRVSSARAQRDDQRCARRFSECMTSIIRCTGRARSGNSCVAKAFCVARCTVASADAGDGPGRRGAWVARGSRPRTPVQWQPARRSRRSPVRGDPSESALGLRLHLRGDLGWVHLRGVRDRRLRAAHRGLAGVGLDAHGLRARRLGAGPLRAPRRRADRPRASQRCAARSIFRCGIRIVSRPPALRHRSGAKAMRIDNALAESVIGLVQDGGDSTDEGPWRTLEAVEFATLDVGGLVQYATTVEASRGLCTSRVRGAVL